MGRIHMNLSLIYIHAFTPSLTSNTHTVDWLNNSEAAKNIWGVFAPLHPPGYTYKWEGWLPVIVIYLIMLGKVHW